MGKDVYTVYDPKNISNGANVDVKDVTCQHHNLNDAASTEAVVDGEGVCITMAISHLVVSVIS